MPNLSDRALDPVSWLADHGDYLFAYAMSRLGDTEASEDMVQETLLAAIAARGSFAGRSSIRTWLAGILKHKLIDSVRQRQREPSSQRKADQSSSNLKLEQWTDSQFTAAGKWRTAPQRWHVEPGQWLEQAEFRAVLARCLEKLPPQAERVVLLTDQQGLSADRVSKHTGLTTTNIGVILHRARTALRHCLELHWFGTTKGKIG